MRSDVLAFLGDDVGGDDAVQVAGRNDVFPNVPSRRVLVLLHMRAVGRTSGIATETRYAHSWTMQGGRGVLVEAYRDQESAVRAFEDASGATTP